MRLYIIALNLIGRDIDIRAPSFIHDNRAGLGRVNARIVGYHRD